MTDSDPLAELTVTDKPVVLTAELAAHIVANMDEMRSVFESMGYKFSGEAADVTALRDLAAGRTLCVSAEIVARERDGFACSELTLRALRANTEGWTPLYRAQEDGQWIIKQSPGISCYASNPKGE